MLTVISPAKTLDLEQNTNGHFHSAPAYMEEASELINVLKEYSTSEIQELMGISDKLADLNKERFAAWKKDYKVASAKQAVLTFKGDVYQGLEAEKFNQDELHFMQGHLRILSGLYGLLKPMDLIQPYRLEMGTQLPVNGKKNLYEFWDNKLAEDLNTVFAKTEKPVLVNLASNEYFKAAKAKNIKAEVITPVFKDYKNGKYKVISFFAKKARGMMVAFMVKNRITNPEDLKAFDVEGYSFNAEMSKGNEWVFTRNNEA
ncbi:peroxide stress protein YaaA [Limibacter armeniacum]|uniref:peroxide stress protein YaaA n=1 Tax=Limibacter armeniacum TaxID=466084 RepID=UPI002FE5F427